MENNSSLHDYNQRYSFLSIVYVMAGDEKIHYIAKKDVPRHTKITDTNYWKNIDLDVNAPDYSDITGKPKINGVEVAGELTSQDLGVYSKPATGIPQSDLAESVQSQLNNHFKGWYDSEENLPDNPMVGDYAYVKSATSSDPAAIYECTTAGTWSDSERTVDTSSVQTFESGEAVNEIGIDDSPTPDSDNLVKSGGVYEKLDVLEDAVFETEDKYVQIANKNDLTTTWYDLTGTKVATSSGFDWYGYKVSCKNGDSFIIKTYGGNTARAYAITDSNNNILERADAGAHYISTPLELNISQQNAEWLYINCNNANSNSFNIKKFQTVSTDKISYLEEQFDGLYSNNTKTNTILLLGASMAYSENQWFRWACNKLKMTGINKAVSGTNIRDNAKDYLSDELYTSIEDFDILAIMHVHNRNIMAVPEAYISYTWEDYENDTDFANVMNNGIVTDFDKWYSLAFDYILKKYAAKCVACKDDPNSKWYGTNYGKPFVVVLCTYWHDARITINTTIRQLSAKWGCWLCDFAANIGFSYKQPVYDGTNYIQPSVMYVDEVNPTETITLDGVQTVVGWHPLRDSTSYIQMRMATIFYDSIKKILW